MELLTVLKSVMTETLRTGMAVQVLASSKLTLIAPQISLLNVIYVGMGYESLPKLVTIQIGLTVKGAAQIAYLFYPPGLVQEDQVIHLMFVYLNTGMGFLLEMKIVMITIRYSLMDVMKER